MSKDQIDVRHVAKLARLDLTEEEIETFQSQLESVMRHVHTLSELTLPEDLDPDNGLKLGLMRDDTPHGSLAQELVMRNAPDQAHGQIRVPKVVADA